MPAYAVKHLHYLLADGPCREIDAYAVGLVLASRGGNRVLAGDEQRRYRDALASLLDGGLLAELLASARPIRVLAGRDHYRIEEL